MAFIIEIHFGVLHCAVDKDYLDMVKYILSLKKINLRPIIVLIIFFFLIQFHLNFFNELILHAEKIFHYKEIADYLKKVAKDENIKVSKYTEPETF